jgi:hypothetical protein
MALPPIDLSPFRILVDFFAGAYIALVSIRVSSGAGTQRSLRNWIEFVEPDIGMFGSARIGRCPTAKRSRSPTATTSCLATTSRRPSAPSTS